MKTAHLQTRIKSEILKQSPTITEDTIVNIGRKITAILEKTVHLDEASLQYNIPFFVQALLRNPSTRLRVDNPHKILYPQESIVIPLTKNRFFDMLLRVIPGYLKLSYFIQNFDILSKEFSKRKEEIEKVLQDGNLVIISNHASWMNLAIIAICLHTYCNVSKEKIYTLLGPAITTRLLPYSMINFSNLIKTVPNTTNGNILPEELAKSLRKDMFETLSPIFREGKGNILLVAPSGTTDKYDEKSGTFTMQKPTNGTHTLLKRLSAKSKILVIGINDKEVMPDNSGFKRGDVFIKFGEISDSSSIVTEMEELPEKIINKNGECIGSWEKQ